MKFPGILMISLLVMQWETIYKTYNRIICKAQVTGHMQSKVHLRHVTLFIPEILT